MSMPDLYALSKEHRGQDRNYLKRIIGYLDKELALIIL